MLNIADFAGKRKKHDDFDEKSVNNADFDEKSPARMSENCQKNADFDGNVKNNEFVGKFPLGTPFIIKKNVKSMYICRMI